MMSARGVGGEVFGLGRGRGNVEEGRSDKQEGRGENEQQGGEQKTLDVSVSVTILKRWAGRQR